MIMRIVVEFLSNFDESFFAKYNCTSHIAPLSNYFAVSCHSIFKQLPALNF